MMEALRQYIVSVTGAAILCGIITGMHSGKGASASLIKLIAGIFLAFVVVNPLSRIEPENIISFSSAYSADADAAVTSGESMAMEAMASIIKSNTEAYILDKAEKLGAALRVEIVLSGETTIVPAQARLSGDVSPYAKLRLQTILEEELGISKENQVWTG